jgi:hypothetical protein
VEIIFPVNSTIENTYEKIHKHNETILCYGYEKDLIQIYDFYCARYENITYEEFMEKGISEIQKKLMSIPESEPLYTIIKSRVINLAKIKDKNERKHWRELKEANKIPDIYKPNNELDINLNKKLGGINGKRFM